MPKCSRCCSHEPITTSSVRPLIDPLPSALESALYQFMRSKGVIVAAAILLAACRGHYSNVAPSAGSTLISDRLYFGRNIHSGGVVSDSAWNVFLDEVVTPRFPNGFGYSRTMGQWRYADGAIVREDGFALEVTHPPGSPPDSTFAAIAAEYCRRFQQEAVARETSPVHWWLYNASSR